MTPAVIVRIAVLMSVAAVAVLTVAAHLAVAAVALRLDPWPLRWAINTLRWMLG